MTKVVIATPSLNGPTAPYISALEQSITLITGAGWEEAYVQEVGCPYISSARATLMRRALDAGADVVIYLDYDVSWEPPNLLKLLETPGDVVAGTYRYKKPEEEYMVVVRDTGDGRPLCRPDGCILAERAPAGFLKLTRETVDRFMGGYPNLIFGPRYNPSVDLFNHGAHEGVWWGEDYAFCRNWRALGEQIALVPDLDITHHKTNSDGTTTPYPGNFHKFLLANSSPVGAPASAA
jgi:glycosyltransferase involved in cell wall biosynthesis